MQKLLSINTTPVALLAAATCVVLSFILFSPRAEAAAPTEAIVPVLDGAEEVLNLMKEKNTPSGEVLGESVSNADLWAQIDQLLELIAQLQQMILRQQGMEAEDDKDESKEEEEYNDEAKNATAADIDRIEAKASEDNVLYAGEKAYIHGSGLDGKLKVKLGVAEPKYVTIESESDSYAEFMVPAYDHDVAVSVFVTNDSGEKSDFYNVKILGDNEDKDLHSQNSLSIDYEYDIDDDGGANPEYEVGYTITKYSDEVEYFRLETLCDDELVTIDAKGGVECNTETIVEVASSDEVYEWSETYTTGREDAKIVFIVTPLDDEKDVIGDTQEVEFEVRFKG